MPLGWQLKIHVWPAGRKNFREDIHDHRRGFVSVPICGFFTETRFEISNSGQPTHRLTKSFPEINGSREVVETGCLFKVKQEKKTTRPPLIPYFCPAGQAHCFEPKESGLHLTIVLAGRPVTDYARVYFPLGA